MNLRRPMIVALCAATLCAQANPASDRLSAMPEATRAAALAGAIQSNGERCPAVTSTYLQGNDRRGNAMWNARCTNAESFVVQVNNDASGSMRVTNCKVALSMNATPCFSRMR